MKINGECMHVKAAPQDGRGFEVEFSGYSFERAKAIFSKYCRVCGFKHQIRRIKECQHCLGWNPRLPRTELSRSLYERVASRLGSEADKLRLFMAIGSKLDFRGIDFWFESSGHRMVTIDLTVSQSKDYARADFVLTRGNFLRDEHYQIGDAIAEKLLH